MLLMRIRNVILSLIVSLFLAPAANAEILCSVDGTSTNTLVLKLASAPATTMPIFRKAPGETEWTSVGEISTNSTDFADLTAEIGVPYHYLVGSGNDVVLLYAGLDVPAVHARGKVVLLIDDAYESSLTNELDRLVQDLAGDGWTVIRHTIPHALEPDTAGQPDQVLAIRGLLQSIYNADPTGVKGAFIIGHAAVPLSGNQEPGGHDDWGATAADGFYTDMLSGFGVLGWSDEFVNTTNQYKPDSTPRLPREGRRNIPGDGKFDQELLPSGAQLFLGRVDMDKLTNVTATIPELLRRYLNKDHAYRSIGIRDQKGLVKGTYRFLTPSDTVPQMYSILGSVDSILHGATNQLDGPSNQFDWWYLLLSPTGPYDGFLWAMGTSAAGDSSVEGIATSDDYRKFDPRAIFITHGGSYFQDYDFTDNILRALITTTNFALGSGWVYGPTFELGLGTPIGHCLQNLQNSYEVGGGTHAQAIRTWLGDPTIRPHVVPPVTALSASAANGVVSLSWTAPSNTVAGYYIYRSSNLNGPFALLNESPVSTNAYSTSQTNDGLYMVRATALQQTGSGSYWNLSQGAFAQVQQSKPLAITLSPQSLTMTLGRVATFAVAAEASSNGVVFPLTYQWRHNGTNLSNSTNKIEGATRSWLAIRNLGTNDGGYYDVVVSAAGQTQTSSTVMLFLNQKPQKLTNSISISTDEETSTNIDLSIAFQDDNVPSQWSVARIGFPNTFSGNGPTFTPNYPAGFAEVTPDDQTIHYSPLPGKFGEDSFRYTVTDGLESDWGIVNVTINDTSLAHDLLAFGWQGAGVGDGYGYSRVLHSGKWEVTGGGLIDDPFAEGYLEQRVVAGDFEFIARLESVLYGDAAGITIREDLDPSSRMVEVDIGQDGKYILLSRTSGGGALLQPTILTNPVAQFPDGWLKLTRAGNQINAYVSTNGSSWTSVGSTVTITSLASSLRVGMATHGNVHARGVFSSVQVKTILLSSPVRSGNGSFQFALSGAPASSSCSVDVTEDMVTWTNLGTVTSDGSGEAAASDSLAAGKKMRFYRVSSGAYRSLNSVGFIERSATSNATLSAVQVRSAGFTASSVAPLAASNATIYAYSDPEGSPGVSSFDPNIGWDPDISLGLFNTLYVDNPSVTAFKLLFVGEAPLGIWRQLILGNGVDDYRASLIPVKGSITSVLGYVPTSGDTVYRYLPGGTAIDTYDSEIGWDPEEPVLDPGEAFVLYSTASQPAYWTQELKIWP